MKKKPNETFVPGQPILDRLPKNRGEYLALILRFTERAIRYPEDHMTFQAGRLRQELEDWKKANPL